MRASTQLADRGIHFLNHCLEAPALTFGPLCWHWYANGRAAGEELLGEEELMLRNVRV